MGKDKRPNKHTCVNGYRLEISKYCWIIVFFYNVNY